MGRHALRGMVTAWLSLIVLQTISTKGGSGRVASAFGDLNGLLVHALSPDVPAIPDRRGGAGGSGSKAGGSAFVVGQGSHAPVNLGADPTIVRPEAPYARPSDLPVPTGNTAGGGSGTGGRTFRI